MSTMLLSHAGILTFENGDWKYIPEGYLGINGDTIDYVGEEIPKNTYDTEKNMSGKLLMPGLINCHSHAPMVLLRGVGSDLALQDWLFNKVFPIEDKLTPSIMKAGYELAVLEMLASGTTSFTDMYMLPEIACEVVGAAGMRCNVARIMQEFVPGTSYEANGRGAEQAALFDKYNNTFDGRVRIDYSIHAEYTSQPELNAQYAKECKERGACMHLHLSETKKEHQECIDKYGKTPAEWFNDLGVFDNPTLAAHCVWVSDSDLEILKEKGVTPVHNPTSNMKLGSGFAPIQKMLDMGINTALGTDGAASNNNVNMFEEMHIASIIHNGYTGDPEIMKAGTVLKMATLNGAKAQQRFDIGNLQKGMKADVIAIDLEQPHLFPNLDAAALVVYAAQGSDVCMTMVNGKILYENGVYLTMDKERIMASAKDAVSELYN